MFRAWGSVRAGAIVAMTALAAAFLLFVGAGPAAAASDISFDDVPALGVPGQIYTILALSSEADTITASASGPCEVIAQDDGTGYDLITVAVDLGAGPEAPGTCDVTATDATGSASASFTTEGMDLVGIISSPPTPSLADGTYLVSASSISSNPVTFSIAGSSTDNCTVGTSMDDEATVTFGSTAGTCVIDAATASENNWVGASASQTVQVLLSDAITLSQAPEPEDVSGSYAVTASDLSGNTVSFAIDSSSTNACTITSTGTDQALVTFGPAPGSCIVDASTAAGNEYAAATAAEMITVVAPPTQTIEFSSSPPSPALVGGSYYATASATTSDGPPDTPGAVTITVDGSSTPGACTIGTSSAGSATVELTGAGTCTLDATAAASSGGAPAVSTEQSFMIAYPAPSSVAVSAGSGQSAPQGSPFTVPLSVIVTGNGIGIPGVTVTFSVTSGSASFAGSATVTATTNASGVATAPALTAGLKTGRVTVSASVAGVAQPATFSESVTRAFADLSISVSASPTVAPGGTVTTTITVTNRGPDLAPAVVTDFTVLSGYTVVSADGGTRIGPLLQWADPSLATGTSVSYTVVVQVPAHAKGLVISGALTYSAAVDPNPFNNVGGAVTKVT